MNSKGDMNDGDIKRSDNHLDYFATTGQFEDIFEQPLYGYFYNRFQGEPRKNLKFTLYFADPFDPVTDKYGDLNGFCKQEKEGFDKEQEHVPLEETSKMQIVPLQYHDFYAYKDDRARVPWRTEPNYDEALLNNIYDDRRSFFKRLLNQNPHQIKKYQENSILYKVIFDLPFDVIAPYVTVDKTFRLDGAEKTKNLYSGDKSHNVEELFKKMQRTKSLLDEMDSIIHYIRDNPEQFKQESKGEWATTCSTKSGFNIENATYLHKKLQEAFNKMEEVLFQARYFDIRAEPKEPEFVKCVHDACTRNAIKGSRFCGKCIELNTRECNYCGK